MVLGVKHWKKKQHIWVRRAYNVMTFNQTILALVIIYLGKDFYWKQEKQSKLHMLKSFIVYDDAFWKNI